MMTKAAAANTDVLGLKCTKRVFVDGGWHRHPCGRDAVGRLSDGEPGCRLHLAGEARTAKNAAERETAQQAEEQRMERAEAAQKAIAALAGLATALEYTAKHGYTGKVVVDPDALLAVLRAKL